MSADRDDGAIPQSDAAADNGSNAVVTESGDHSTAEASHPSETTAAATGDGIVQQQRHQQPESSRKGDDDDCAPNTKSAEGQPERPKEVEEEGQDTGTRSPTNAKSGNKPLLPADRELLPLLSLPPSARFIVVEEHESHRARLEAIAAGRSTSQATAMSYLSSVSGTRSPRKQDPCVETHHQNHKKALANIQQGGLRHSLVHVTHYKRLGNTFAVPEEFLDPKHPEHRASARESRLYHNSYRNGRLLAAERVDEENAKFVTALIHVKPVLPSAVSLLEQERERQALLRRIERGPVSARGVTNTLATSHSNASSSDVAAKREAQWDNHVNPWLPKPPPVGSVITSHEVSQPHVLWQTKIRMSREQERNRLLEAVSGAQESVRDAPAGGSDQVTPGPLKPAPKQERIFRPKPPAVGLSACIEKMPSVSSGRHAGKPAPEKAAETKPRVVSFRRSPAARNSHNSGRVAPESEEHPSHAQPVQPAAAATDAQPSHAEPGAQSDNLQVSDHANIAADASKHETAPDATQARDPSEVGQSAKAPSPTEPDAQQRSVAVADEGLAPGVNSGDAVEQESSSIQA